MPLTEAQIKKLRNGVNKKGKAVKSYKIFDGRGLFIEVPATGNKRWRFKYHFDGKEKLLALGVWPNVSLREARAQADQARTLLSRGADPSVQKTLSGGRSLEESATLRGIAEEWLELNRERWVPIYHKKLTARLNTHLLPYLGGMQPDDITAPDLLRVLRKIEDNGAIETARRVLGAYGLIARYAIATGRAQRDISRDLRGALKPSKPKHMAAETDPKRLGVILNMLDAYQGSATVMAALKLAPMLFVRPGELRTMEWADVDLEAAQWSFTTSKTGTDHIVPLARQAVAILEEQKLHTGQGRYVFPNPRSAKRPMSENAVLVAMRTAGIEQGTMTGHGWRAVARTLLDEVLEYPPHLIEQQLAHVVRDPLGRAYNRTKHLPQRREMMQAWADYLENLRKNR